MKSIEYLVAPLLLLLCSCQEKIDYWMTDAATVTMDRIVGEYVLESISWSLGPVDLGGDGVADPDFTKEMAAEFLSRFEDLSHLTVKMVGNERYKARMNWAFCPVAEINYVVGRSWQNVHWMMFPAGGEIELDEDGNIVSFPGFTHSYDYDKVDGRREEVCYLRHPTYSFEGDGRLVFTADTAVYDYASDTVQRGTVTYSFKCVSGKGKLLK